MTGLQPNFLSIVVPVYNAAETIAGQLDALATQTYSGETEIVIVDNRSTDASVSVALTYASRLNLRVVSADKEQGVAHARNVGIEKAGGDLILVCDADDIVEDTWVARLVEAAAAYDLVGGKAVRTVAELKTLDPLRPLQHRPVVPIGESFWRFEFAAGFSFAVWRTTANKIGPFDGCIPFAEDADFSLRVQQQGLCVGLCNASAYYRPRDTLYGTFMQQVNYGCSVVALYRKHRPRGMQRRPIGVVLRRWGYWLLRTPLAIAREHERTKWARNIGKSVGYLYGSARLLTWYP